MRRAGWRRRIPFFGQFVGIMYLVQRLQVAQRNLKLEQLLARFHRVNLNDFARIRKIQTETGANKRLPRVHLTLG